MHRKAHIRKGNAANAARPVLISPSQKPQNKTTAAKRWFCFGGRRWIRTTEVTDNRFTVCPLWPLGNSPI